MKLLAAIAAQPDPGVKSKTQPMPKSAKKAVHSFTGLNSCQKNGCPCFDAALNCFGKSLIATLALLKMDSRDSLSIRGS